MDCRPSRTRLRGGGAAGGMLPQASAKASASLPVRGHHRAAARTGLHGERSVRRAGIGRSLSNQESGSILYSLGTRLSSLSSFLDQQLLRLLLYSYHGLVASRWA